MTNKQYYFDLGATPLSPTARAAMAPYELNYFGNPESIHRAGQVAKGALEKARLIVAHLIGAAKKEEVIFTSGATESDNLALKGVALHHYQQTQGRLTQPHLLISPIEHPAVRESALSLKDFGFQVEFLPVTKEGVIEPAILAQKITPQTLLVSIIAANNQFGTVQDLAALGKICRQKKIVFHTDASVYFGVRPFKVQDNFVDLATLSSPKIYGPKGVAALYLRSGIKLYPLQHGGGQEFGLRSGTHNLPAIVGFAAAAQEAAAQMTTREKHDQQLSAHFIRRVQTEIPHVLINSTASNRLANNVHLSILGVEGESLVLALDQFGIAASSGSACSSRHLQADPALKALRLTPEAVHGSLRFFWHEWTTLADLDYLVAKLKIVVTNLRQISAYKV